MKVPMETSAEDTQKNLYEESTANLADWENAPTVQDLKQDFTQAKSAHGVHTAQVTRWLDNLHASGSARVTSNNANRSKIVPRLIRKQAEWRYASLSESFLSTDDLFDVNPVTFEDKQAAVQNQLVLNNQFNAKINKIKFIDDFVRTAVDEGTVIVKVNWDYEEEVEEVEVPIMEQQSIYDAVSGQTILGEPVVVGTRIEQQTKIIKNQPALEICHYNNVIIDPGCEGDIDKASFIIYSFETSLSELKKDDRYTNLDKIIVNNQSVLARPDHVSMDQSYFNFKDKPRQRFVVYEYWGFWDINNTGIVKPIVATYVGETMIRLEENPYPDKKLPFIVVPYLPVRKSIYGEPDGALLEENQKIVGAITRGMIDTMGRSANGQIAIVKGVLDPVDRRKFDKGLDYEINPNVPNPFYMNTYPELPASSQIMLNMQNQEAEALTGVKAYSGGITGDALGTTATGVRNAVTAAGKREMGILRRLAIGITQIGRKIIAMNSVFLSEEEVVRITNEEFVEIRRDDLAGNFDLNLSISTAEVDNEKAQELSFMLQTMGNNMDPELSKMILVDIAKLRKMPTLAKQISEYQPQPDPTVQKQRELELALLEAKVLNEQAKGQENQADVAYKQARTTTEIAKSRNMDSKTDTEDLRYLDKSSGQDVQDDLLKQEFNRKSQLDIKAADHLLNGSTSQMQTP